MKPIIVVAGLARSGLTLTMQMLHAGGFPCAGERPGFAPFPLGRIPWNRLEGQAVKLVDSHRHFPPDGMDLRVIRLRRKSIQQARSFNKFVGVWGMQKTPVNTLIASFDRDYKIIDRWARKQQATLSISFESLVTDTERSAQKLAEFVQSPLDIDRMKAVVIQRSTKCHPRMLELEME